MEEQAKYNTIKNKMFEAFKNHEWVIEDDGEHFYMIAAYIKPKITQNDTSTNDEEDLTFYGKFYIASRVVDEQIARLMSAAPDLLVALQNVFVHAKGLINENHPHYKKAVKAINKALGINGNQAEETKP